AHTAHAEVSFASTFAQDLLFDALAVVPDVEPELTIVIAKLELDLLCSRVPERVAQCFVRDADDFVAHDRMQCSRPTLHLDLKSRSSGAAFLGSELLAERSQRHGEVVGLGDGGAQALYGIAPFRDCLRRLIEGAVEDLAGLGWICGQHGSRRLEAKQESVE